MESIEVIDITRDAIGVLLKLSLPFLLVALLLGFIISLIQALTQIQEPTLSFVPKIVSIFLMLLFFAPIMGHIMSNFTEKIFQLIVNIE
jgi:flagellar biosynthetic protein FliQ